MPLITRESCRTFHSNLYGGVGCLETITLLKRGDGQNAGTVTSYQIFEARRAIITKTGEQIQGDMTSDHRCTWHIPKVELDRVGVSYLNFLDRIVNPDGTWQPEANVNTITQKLMGEHVCVECVRVDPPT